MTTVALLAATPAVGQAGGLPAADPASAAGTGPRWGVGPVAVGVGADAQAAAPNVSAVVSVRLTGPVSVGASSTVFATARTTPVGPVGPGTAPPGLQAIPDAPGITSLISVSSGVEQGDGASGGPPPVAPLGGPVLTHGGEAISADGRWVAFVSYATNLAPGDTNATADIFLRDRASNTTIRIPYLDGTDIPDRYAAAEPTISADGSVVAFTVYQKNTPSTPIGVFWWSAQTGVTQRGSVDDGVLFPATQPSLSPDGRYLAWVRPYSLRKANFAEIFISDLRTGNATRLSGPDSEPVTGHNTAPSLSRDGRFLAFQSDAAFTPDDQNKQIDIYLLDRTTDTFLRLTAVPGGDVNGFSSDPSIDDDGGVVAFGSLASNLTSDPTTPGLNQIYVWERATGAVRRVSLDQGSHAADASFNASVSADGNFVAFWSAQPYVPPPPTGISVTPRPGILLSGGPGDVFLRDLRRDLTTRISVDSAAQEVTGDSLYPSVSGDGMATAFASTATTLVGADANGFGDVFVRELIPAATVAPDSLDFGTKILGTLGGPQTVTVTSTGWPPLDVRTITITGTNAGDFRVATTTCAGARLPQGQTCTVQVTFKPTATGARTATLVITDTSRTSPHSVALTGSGGELTLKVNPPIGPPGIVTTVTGTGFPPGGRVALQWDRGITATMAPVVVGADGTFKVGMLVLHHDQIGPRKLIAVDVGGGSFPTSTVDFLVVVPTAQPPAIGPFSFLPANARPIVSRH